MKLKDFKEWLNQFPDDTIVEVSEEQRGYERYSSFTVFDPDDHSFYCDYRNNPLVERSSSLYNKRILQLGSI